MVFFDGEMELREHHCWGDETGLTAGPGLDKISDDPLNAWIPQGTTFEEDNVSLLFSLLNISFCLQTAARLVREEWRDGALRDLTMDADQGAFFFFFGFEQGELKIYDPIASCERVYQTYRTDAENPYASGFVQESYLSSDDRVNPEEDKLAQLAAQITNKEPEPYPDETQGLVDSPSYIDNDDQPEDAVEHLSSGIRDIVITGRVRLAHNSHSLPMWALCPCRQWAVESDIWVSTPCDALSVFGAKSRYYTRSEY